MDRITEIQARLAEINTQLDAAEGDALTALETESRSLLAEMEGIKNTAQARQKLRDQIAAGAGAPSPTPAPSQASTEQRAADEFARSGRMTIPASQVRALTIATGKLAQPQKTTGINDPIGAAVSGFIDLVNVVDCSGMGKHRVAYRKATTATAAKQTEGAAITPATLAEFDFVDISPETVAVLDYISAQAKRQTTLNYHGKVREQAIVALRRAATQRAVAALAASTLVTKKEGNPIDATTLRTLALSYGNDESVMGGAILLLNKADLFKFGDVRGTNEKKALYEITPDATGNMGTIREGGLHVRYCISSDVTEGTLYYGAPRALEMGLFSDFKVDVSEDFAFDKLMDTIRGNADIGFGVTVPGGFIAYTTGA